MTLQRRSPLEVEIEGRRLGALNCLSKPRRPARRRRIDQSRRSVGGLISMCCLLEVKLDRDAAAKMRRWAAVIAFIVRQDGATPIARQLSEAPAGISTGKIYQTERQALLSPIAHGLRRVWMVVRSTI